MGPATSFCSRDCYYASLKVPLERVYLVDGGRCHLCGGRVRWRDASRDHILPRSLGGATTWSNIRLAHRRCNSQRGNEPLDAARAAPRDDPSGTPFAI